MEDDGRFSKVTAAWAEYKRMRELVARYPQETNADYQTLLAQERRALVRYRAACRGYAAVLNLPKVRGA